ncbi:MmcQ/YjbR family DNA-binding protein [Amycolatopsis cynarae]|uniref:MmcQ/YjbR family DNA-binding protein n=1 Tax=Amycolatopsis cynarae TaxID=2995223 RepID=A0ABY7AX48_9PSEU|nr:MmcQ/YjbR family DNA-binding protein [Amycolatopsis sp. HUAS 11-8]WAL63203.1 MmcQ/YjbR family DNA-binding protein [Amycolatopsis sp. HUAS 11-8]
MSTVADLRRIALALPGVTEGTHFRMVAFRVRDKGFAGVDKDGYVQLALGEEEATAVVAEDPAVFGEVTRGTRRLGVRFDPAKVDERRLTALVELSWRHTR